MSLVLRVAPVGGYFIFVRRGDLVAGITGLGQVPEAQVQAVAAAIDRAMRETE